MGYAFFYYMPDYWLEHPEALQGQPKRVIGEYVESEGISVPRRFSTLAEARASGLDILVRSELQQDYDGISGLLLSLLLKWFSPDMSEDGIKKYIWENGMEQGLGKNYCNLLGIDMLCRINRRVLRPLNKS